MIIYFLALYTFGFSLNSTGSTIKVKLVNYLTGKRKISDYG